jgi:hypothetical protein
VGLSTIYIPKLAAAGKEYFAFALWLEGLPLDVQRIYESIALSR